MQHDVVVHKSDIQLAEGESIQSYTQSLSDAIRKYAVQKLNFGAGPDGRTNGSCYVIEAYGDTAVISAYKYSSASDPGWDKYFSIGYERNDKGVFKFSDWQEVERVTSYQPKEPMSVTKAQWTAAYINDLPDAAFAYIAPGGKKDAEGKTTPRSLRYLPHHDASVKSGTENGSVDLAHLRNALARVNQANIPSAAKSSAKAHLMAHAKELLPTEAKKHLGTEVKPGWFRSSTWSGIL